MWGIMDTKDVELINWFFLINNICVCNYLILDFNFFPYFFSIYNRSYYQMWYKPHIIPAGGYSPQAKKKMKEIKCYSCPAFEVNKMAIIVES